MSVFAAVRPREPAHEVSEVLIAAGLWAVQDLIHLRTLCGRKFLAHLRVLKGSPERSDNDFDVAHFNDLLVIGNRNPALGEFDFEIVPSLLHHASFTFCCERAFSERFDSRRLPICAGGIELWKDEDGAERHRGKPERNNAEVEPRAVVDRGVTAFRDRAICTDGMVW
jgi:hypothetical protein